MSHRSSFVVVAVILALTSALVGCKGSKKRGEEESAAAENGPRYGTPVGARINGNAKVVSFELALAADGAEPDELMPLVIQAASAMTANCGPVPAALSSKGLVSITFESKAGLLDPALIQSEMIDDAGLTCVRQELTKAISKAPHAQRVRYLLQVRPLSG